MVRIVISISTLGTAQKLITVRSSLVIESHIQRPLKLYTKTDVTAVDALFKDDDIVSGKNYFIDIHETNLLLTFIPKEWCDGFEFSSVPLDWRLEENKQKNRRKPIIDILAKHKSEHDFW